MAILTWQNVPIPDIGNTLQQGTRTAGEMLNRAVTQATTGIGEMQKLQEAQKAAEVAAADRFALTNMLRAQTPEQLAQMQTDGSLFGTAANRVSPQMMVMADSRRDALRQRIDGEYASGRTRTLDGRADQKHASEQALAARRQQQEAGLNAAYAEAMLTGNPRVVERWLASNADFAASGDQADRLNRLLGDYWQRRALQAKAQGGGKAGAGNQGFIDRAVGEIILADGNPEVIRQTLAQVPAELRQKVTEELRKNVDPTFYARNFAETSPNSAGGAKGKGTSEGPPPASTPVGRDIEAKFDKELADREVKPGHSVGTEILGFKGKSASQIQLDVGKSLGIDSDRAGVTMNTVRGWHPNLTDAQIGAILKQPRAVTNDTLWWTRDKVVVKQNKGARDTILDQDAIAELAKTVGPGLADAEVSAQLRKDQAAYRKANQEFEAARKNFERAFEIAVNAPNDVVAKRARDNAQTKLNRAAQKLEGLNREHGFGPAEEEAQKVSEALTSSTGAEINQSIDPNTVTHSVPVASHPKKEPVQVSSSESFTLGSNGSVVPASGVLEVPKRDLGKAQTVVQAEKGAIPKGQGQKVLVTYVTDGDTFFFQEDLGGKQASCRIDSINAPEVANRHKGTRDQPFAQNARQALADMILRKQVTIKTSEKKDRHGRYVCQVELEGVAVDAEMVKQGLAVVIDNPEFFPDSERAASLRQMQSSARDQGLNIFSPGGVVPYNFSR